MRRVLVPARWIKNSLYTSRRKSRERIFLNLRNFIVSDPLIRVDTFCGTFAMDVRSDLFRRIIENGEYESYLAKYCLQYLDRNRDVIDVGANIGFYTVLFAKQLYHRKVLSLEPTQRAYERLLRNILENGVAENVIVFNGVAAESTGTREINFIEGKEEYSSLGEMAHPSIVGQVYDKQRVSSSSIDDLVEINHLDPGFIKVDTEGCEHMVFSGCQQTLRQKRPVILSELSNPLLSRNGSSSREVIEMIRNHDYKVIDPLYPDIDPGARPYGDILCIPTESAA
ncbi:MAG: FkbM family methyltransferase [Nitrososphaera sp.]|nr:FkbM family methyltransferase [Gammaproteobacteria bacterium]MCI0558888.1 FkbM family methyltransferase [Nitrososphaera sp.]